MSLKGTLSKCIAIIYSCSAFANCTCTLNFPEDSENKPRYMRIIGNHIIEIPYKLPSAYIFDGGNFTAYCATRFEGFDVNQYYRDTDTFVELYCNGAEIYHSGDDFPITEQKVLSCVDLKWGVYESVSSFSWCPADSFILASEEYSGKAIILSGACIDVTKSSIRTLHYVIGPNIRTEDHNDLKLLEPFGLETASLDKEVKSYFHLLRNYDINKNTYRPAFWTFLVNYEFRSIVQGGPYSKFFSKYDSLLNIEWWPNLAAGNWKRFMDALDKRAKKVTYNVFMGTSGVVQVPHTDKCTSQSFEELQIVTQNENGTVPAYIWTYLEDKESDEEFVFVGYNAPFYEFFSEKTIVFCNDICKNVTWLENIRSTFRYSAMGVTFCCSVEDVRSGNLLEGFPVAVEPTVDGTDDSAPLTESEHISKSNEENIINVD